MDTGPLSPELGFMESLSRRRAELRESINALERALAAPAPGRLSAWAEHVQSALVELSADFREHIQITEGRDGLYQGLLETAPRLSHAVTRLTGEHVAIASLIDEVLASLREADLNQDVSEVRDRGTALLGDLVRHRQLGSDLVYEAYQTDIGGET